MGVDRVDSKKTPEPGGQKILERGKLGDHSIVIQSSTKKNVAKNIPKLESPEDLGDHHFELAGGDKKIAKVFQNNAWKGG